MTHTRVKPDVTGTGFRRPSFRRLPGARAACGWALFMLLLGWGSASPARADLTVDATNSPYTIRDSFTGTVYVNPGCVLNVVDGAQISADSSAVVNTGGTVNISGGSISAATYDGVIVYSGGIVNITG